MNARTNLTVSLATALALLVLAPLPAAGQGTEATPDIPGTAPLALTPAEYNNTIADLLGFPRDGERWPERPAIADTLSPRRAASKGVFLPPPPPGSVAACHPPLLLSLGFDAR